MLYDSKLVLWWCCSIAHPNFPAWAVCQCIRPESRPSPHRLALAVPRRRRPLHVPLFKFRAFQVEGRPSLAKANRAVRTVRRRRPGSRRPDIMMPVTVRLSTHHGSLARSSSWYRHGDRVIGSRRGAAWVRLPVTVPLSGSGSVPPVCGSMTSE